MKSIYYSFVAFFWGGVLLAQSPQDTLLHRVLQEVSVSQIIPINQDQVVGIFQANRFSSIDDINARLPGVSLIRRGAYAMEPQINGFSSGQINVTIDGMHLFGACTDKMDPITSYVETENLNSLTVNNGTEGSNTGCTIGGAIDMKLVEFGSHETKKNSISAGYGYETVSEGQNANAAWQMSKNKLGFLGNVSLRKHHNYKDAEGNKVMFSQYQKVNLFGSLAYQLTQHQQLKFDVIYDNATNVGYPALPMDVATAEGQIYGLDYKLHHAGAFSNVHTKLYYNTIYHLMDDSQRDSLFSLGNGVDSVYMRMDMPGWSATSGAYIEGDLNLKSGKKLYLKSDYYYNKARADMTMFMTNSLHPNEPPMFTETWPETGRAVVGLSAKYPIIATNRSLLSYSFRADYGRTEMVSENGKQQFTVFGYAIKKTYNNLITSSNITYKHQLSKQWNGVIGIGYGERLPTLTEQFGFYLFNAKDGYDYIGNPDIKTEKAVQASIALSFSSAPFKANFRSQISHISDYIFGKSETSIPKMNLYARGTKVYSNMAYADISSSSLEVIIQATKDVSFISVSEFTLAENSDGDALPMIPPLNTTSLIQWQKRQLKCIGELVVSAKQNRINTDYNETSTNGYYLINTRLQYDIEIEQGTINLFCGVNNILNTSYREHLDWGNFNRAGRNIFVQMYVTF